MATLAAGPAAVPTGSGDGTQQRQERTGSAMLARMGAAFRSFMAQRGVAREGSGELAEVGEIYSGVGRGGAAAMAAACGVGRRWSTRVQRSDYTRALQPIGAGVGVLIGCSRCGGSATF